MKRFLRCSCLKLYKIHYSNSTDFVPLSPLKTICLCRPLYYFPLNLNVFDIFYWYLWLTTYVLDRCFIVSDCYTFCCLYMWVFLYFQCTAIHLAMYNVFSVRFSVNWVILASFRNITSLYTFFTQTPLCLLLSKAHTATHLTVYNIYFRRFHSIKIY